MKIKNYNKIFLGKNYIFIFGFPGSGTTILSKQLSINLNASLWLEPYYIWRNNIKDKSFDNFDEKNFTDEIVEKIRKDFFDFYTKSKKKFLIEKEPRNIFNLLIIKKIFPYSKFILIEKKKFQNNLDTINRKIKIRKSKSKISDLIDVYNKIENQKFFRFKLRLILYEIKNFDRIKEYFKKYLNIGTVRWGIKFKKKDKVIYSDNKKDYLFLKKIFKYSLKKLDKKSYITISLEKLASNFNKEINKITKFIGKNNFKNNINLINRKRILKKNYQNKNKLYQIPLK